MPNRDTFQKVEPFIVHQIALSLFGDRYIIIYDNTIQFHSHCYHVKRIEDTAHLYTGHYYLMDANTQTWAMQTDEDFALRRGRLRRQSSIRRRGKLLIMMGKK